MTSGYQISKKRPMGNNKVYAPPQGKYSSNLGSGKFLIATGLKKLSVRGHTLIMLAYRGTKLVRKIGQNANLVNRANLESTKHVNKVT